MVRLYAVSAAPSEQPSLWPELDLPSVAEPATAARPCSEPSRSGIPAAPAAPTPPAALAPLPSPSSPSSPSAGSTGQSPLSRPASVELPPLAPTDPTRPGCPQQLLILDTETTGLDPSTGSCVEVGAVLFRVPERAVLAQVSFLLPVESNPAEPINGIPAAISRLPQPWQAGLSCFEAMLAAADAVLAHNAAFDRQWFGSGMLPLISKPWICSMDDIRWPAERQLRANPSVRDLALAYGVPVWAAHRALTDCIYLAQVFERCANLEDLLEAALEPRQLFRAQLSYAERHRAKEAGFRWNDPVRGAWTRRLSEREVRALSFTVQPVAAA
jgi:DNA polymerase-3 subunit epsilon